MELPAHPESDGTSDEEPSDTGNRVVRLVIVLVVALVAVIVLLHAGGVMSPPSH